jgi:plastocyanin
VTFYRFEAPGTYEYACHLRGHLAYGMVGDIVVTDT